MADLLALRQQLRAQRQKQSVIEQLRLSQLAVQHLIRHRVFLSAQHIACYLPNDGELDLVPMIEQAWTMGKEVYLPVLSPFHHNHLLFLPYRPDDELIPNRFGILEPVIRSRRLVDVKSLDLVLVPLVGFDWNGNRLGMGGGFYDRSFAFLRRRQNWFKPTLLGIAYNFQEVKELARNAWDVPLKGVATETGVRLFSGKKTDR